MTAADRFVVSVRMTGIGDRLASLAAAWRYARDTKRTLVAHWRFGNLSARSMENAFPLCFEAPSELAGVRFLAEADVNVARLPLPRHPAHWRHNAQLELPYLRPAASYADDETAAVRMIRSGRDVTAPTVVFDGCVHDGLVSLEEARTFFSALRPAPALTGELDSFYRDHLQSGPVIGLHVRHGNGGDIMGHARSWDSFATAIDRCVRAIRHARDLLGTDAAVLLCTDSREVCDALGAREPKLMTRPKYFRAPGEGELHHHGNAWLGRDDAVIEMLLLGRCDVVIRYPAGSFFSLYGAVMKSGARFPTVYDLQRPWSQDDPLSPAVISRN